MTRAIAAPSRSCAEIGAGAMSATAASARIRVFMIAMKATAVPPFPLTVVRDAVKVSSEVSP